MRLGLMAGLILGSCNGYVALWRSGSETPLRVYSYSLASLPPVDRAALEQGIPVKNETELAHLLEDYLS